MLSFKKKSTLVRFEVDRHAVKRISDFLLFLDVLHEKWSHQTITQKDTLHLTSSRCVQGHNLFYLCGQLSWMSKPKGQTRRQWCTQFMLSAVGHSSETL